MQINVQATDRLKGKTPVDLKPVLRAIADVLPQLPGDPLKLRVTLDWLQYRDNFREPVSVRRIVPLALNRAQGAGAPEPEAGLEVAIDLRRAGSVDLEAALLEALSTGNEVQSGRTYLEDWGSGSESCIWGFNGLYWNALGLWEEATGREYEQALPSGESDARNSAAARAIIEELFRVWDGLAARNALPEDLHILELGVGNGNQAKVWLDEFLKVDLEQGREYYRRLHYLMGDYSAHVLERARHNVRDHSQHVSSLVLDATKPLDALTFLRSKAFLIYISNVYDNLPTDEVVRIGGQLFAVETRAYITAADTRAICDEYGIPEDGLAGMIKRLIELGPALLASAAPERFGDALRAVRFWRDVWSALRLEERFVPIEGLDIYQVAPGISGEILRSIVESNGDVRMHLSNGAAASFIDSLPLLHPFGVLQCHDLFVTKIEQYETGFRGPGKYDGSVVNWVNGLLLAAVAKRRGFDMQFEPFAFRSGSNIVTLTARIQE